MDALNKHLDESFENALLTAADWESESEDQELQPLHLPEIPRTSTPCSQCRPLTALPNLNPNLTPSSQCHSPTSFPNLNPNHYLTPNSHCHLSTAFPNIIPNPSLHHEATSRECYDTNDNKSKPVWRERKRLPMHIRGMLKIQPSNFDIADDFLPHRTGVNAFNDLENLQAVIIKRREEKRRRLENLVNVKIAKSLRVINVFSKTLTATQASKSEEVDPKTPRLSAQSLARVASYTKLHHAKKHGEIIQFEFIATLNEVDSKRMFTPEWAETRYTQAAEWIRYTLPFNLSDLNDMSPIDYLSKFTKLHYLLERRFRKIFEAYREKGKSFIPRNTLYPALNRLCSSYLTMQNFEILLTHTLGPERDLLFCEFAGVCSVCERRYWSLFIPKTNEVGCRPNIEALDFRHLSYKFKEYKIPIMLQTLLMSLS